MAGYRSALMLGGKQVIVTGGSRGIGRACVLEAVRQGARVLFCSRHDGPQMRAVEEAAAAIGGEGTARGIVADVAAEGDVARLFEVARTTYGAVHGVVSNAAVSHGQLLVTTSTDTWDTVIGVNLTGGFLLLREAVRCFLDQGTGGRIVAIGTLSQSGVSGNASYGASKGGLAGLIRQIAREYGEHGIGASMVIPGYVETELSATLSDYQKRTLIEQCPLQRTGSPAEIAACVTFLLSSASIGLSGSALLASGGLREVPL